MKTAHPDCEICQARNTYIRSKAARWKAAGLCPSCGRERSRYVRCALCRKLDASGKRAARKRRKSALKVAA